MSDPNVYADNEPRYECKTCGTKWCGSTLVPEWGARGKNCTGRMMRIDIERMNRALDSGSVNVPPGLAREEVSSLILSTVPTGVR